MAQHIMGNSAAPYIPGALFFVATSLALMGFVMFLLVTNKKDRQARLSDAKTATSKDMAVE